MKPWKMSNYLDVNASLRPLMIWTPSQEPLNVYKPLQNLLSPSPSLSKLFINVLYNKLQTNIAIYAITLKLSMHYCNLQVLQSIIQHHYNQRTRSQQSTYFDATINILSPLLRQSTLHYHYYSPFVPTPSLLLP